MMYLSNNILVGNRQFRAIVYSYKVKHVWEERRHIKLNLKEQCIQELNEKGLVFVKIVNGEWVKLSKKAIEKKVAQALREKAQQLRKRLASERVKQKQEDMPANPGSTTGGYPEEQEVQAIDDFPIPVVDLTNHFQEAKHEPELPQLEDWFLDFVDTFHPLYERNLDFPALLENYEEQFMYFGKVESNSTI